MSNVTADSILVAKDRPLGSVQFSLAAFGASLLAASVVPDGPPGIGLLLVALAVGAATLIARPEPHSLDLTVFGGLSLLLASMAAVRADPFLVTFNLMAAAGLAALSIGGAGSWLKIFLVWLSPLLRVQLVPGFLIKPFATRIVSGAAAGFGSIFRGIFFAGILVLTFGALFASADAAFARLAEELIPQFDLGLLPARIFIFFVIAFFTVMLALTGPRFESAGPTIEVRASGVSVPRGLNRIEWTIALASLDFLFLAFVAIQLTVLFGGNDYVLKTAGLTYAEYARQGFFQLLVVGVLALTVVAASVRVAERDSVQDQRLLKVFLGVLCGLVLVVLFSALHRLGLYEQAFGFTRARLIGHAVTLWLGGIFILVLASGALRRSDWLPRGAMALTGFALLAFSLINPDGTVVRHNIQRYEQTGKIDVHYLSSLSPDAASDFRSLDGASRECLAFQFKRRLPDEEPWSSFNFSRNRARRVLANLGDSQNACASVSPDVPPPSD